jgi:hypothetical protein
MKHLRKQKDMKVFYHVHHLSGSIEETTVW